MKLILKHKWGDAEKNEAHADSKEKRGERFRLDTEKGDSDGDTRAESSRSHLRVKDM